MEEVYIAAVARTPLGAFQGGLSSISATKLGSIAVQGILKYLVNSPTIT